MKPSVEEVAARFQGRFGRPVGAINTLAFRDRTGAFLRVLVDPHYWCLVGTLPSTFEGYRVVTEQRPSATAFH